MTDEEIIERLVAERSRFVPEWFARAFERSAIKSADYKSRVMQQFATDYAAAAARDFAAAAAARDVAVAGVVDISPPGPDMEPLRTLGDGIASGAVVGYAVVSVTRDGTIATGFSIAGGRSDLLRHALVGGAVALQERLRRG